MKTKNPALRNNILLFSSLLVLTVSTVLLSNVFGIVVNVLILGIIAFVFVFFLSYRYPKYNILILLGANFFVPLLIKMFSLYDIPLGIANEGLCATILLTLILNKKISGLKTLPSVLIIIWVLFLMVELINPYTSSRIAGVFALRSWIPFICSFYIMYSSNDSKRDFFFFLAGIFIFGICAGFYGVYQELIGLPSFDLKWVTMDEERYSVMFTWGRLRKFSFFSSPSEFGMLMVLIGVAAFILFFYTKDKRLKILSIVAGVFCLWSMLYTGSRTAMVMLPVGLITFIALTFHRKAMIVVGVIGLMGAAMMLRPSSGAMFVMSTAFSGNDDPSMNVRIVNRALIRSYIQTNPIGYGMGSTGYLGRKYSPNTFLANFATDSEYVRIAVEAGWAGLLLWSVILAILYGYSVVIYFQAKDPEWKAIAAICVVLFFMIIMGQYPQELFVSQALAITLASVIGMMAKIGYKTKTRTGNENSEDESSEYHYST